jgi:6-phosphofructokinase 2
LPEILTLTPNPALDIATSTPRVEPTSKLRCAPPAVEAGGGGINVARVVARLGGDAVAGFAVGGPTGAGLRARVEAEGIPARVVGIAGETRQSLNVTDETTGEQYRFVLPGPPMSEEEEAALVGLVAAADPAPRWVVLSGSLHPGATAEFVASVASAAGAVGAGLVVDGPTGLMARCRGAFLVKPNLAALEGLTGRALPDTADRVAAARQAMADGLSRNVLVSLGADGALLVSPDGAWTFGAPQVPVASAVGAGDSMVAGIVQALASGRDLVEAVAQGVAAGAAAILTPGTELCRAEDVRRLRAEVTAAPWTAEAPA